jgi:hypothetical protein
MEKEHDFEIIKQRLTDGSFVYAVQVHFGIGQRITLQVIDQRRANELLNILTDAVCWIDESE